MKNKCKLITNTENDLKNMLHKFAVRYPELCQLKAEDKEPGCQIYVIEKSRISFHLDLPQSAERRKAASKYAKRNGIHKE